MDAKLESLNENGDPTLSLMPMENSPLIDKGSTQDQRGYSNILTGLRPAYATSPTPPLDGYDTGAIEFKAEPPKPELVFDDGFESH